MNKEVKTYLTRVQVGELTRLQMKLWTEHHNRRPVRYQHIAASQEQTMNEALSNIVVWAFRNQVRNIHPVLDYAAEHGVDKVIADLNDYLTTDGKEIGATIEFSTNETRTNKVTLSKSVAGEMMPGKMVVRRGQYISSIIILLMSKPE